MNFGDFPEFMPVEKQEYADYIVVLRRDCDARHPQTPDLPLVGEVRREGVLFAAKVDAQTRKQSATPIQLKRIAL